MLEIGAVALLVLYLWLFENEIFMFDELSHCALENFSDSNRLICFHTVICLVLLVAELSLYIVCL